MKRNFFRFLAPSVIGMLLAALMVIGMPSRALADPSAGDTFVVTTTGDTPDVNPGDGICWTGFNFGGPECTLRAALQEANLNNNLAERDVINFTIEQNRKTVGRNAFEIMVESTLSINEPVEINGYTQSGATANTANAPEPFNGTLNVVINGANMSGANTMISVSGDASDTIMRGLIINNNPATAILIADVTDNVQLYGNYLGTNETGLLTAQSATTGGSLLEIKDGATATHIGGVLPEQRNIISGSTGAAVYVGGTTAPSGGFMQGNYIGVGADGITSLANTSSIALDDGVNNFLIGGDSLAARNSIENALSAGVSLQGGSFNNQMVGNRIIGSNAYINNTGHGILSYGAQDSVIRGNTIAQNNNAGIWLDADGSTYSDGFTITGNNIGVLEDGVTALGNISGGIIASKVNNSIIGGTSPGDANIIAHNTGFNSFDSALTLGNNSTNVAILGNSIFNNNGLGIDIYGAGVTPNDNEDYDTGANTLLNFPEGTTTTEQAGNTIINYRLNAPAGQYRIEFFANNNADSSGYGEGQTLLDSQTITKSGTGYKNFSHTVTGTGHTNLAFTATLIDANTPSGFGSTSEFGAMLTADQTDLSITKTLNNPEDLGPGGTLNYTVTVTNNGYSDFDLASLAGDNSFGGSLFVDVLPPDLTFGSVVGNDVACTLYGPGSAGLAPFFANHSEYELMFCNYEGPSHILSEGESYSTSFSTTINNDSDLNIENFVFAPMLNQDPDYSVVVSSFAEEDALDVLMAATSNNVATSGAIQAETDLSITKTLNNPRDITPGATVNYTVNLKNNGPNSINLAQFDGSGNPALTSLFLDILPPDLTLGSVQGTNVECVSPYGPGSAALIPFLSNHSDHEIVLCSYVGSDYILASGQSFATTFSVTIADDSDLSFDNYVFAPVITIDPDGTQVGTAYQGTDAIGALLGQSNNIDHTGAVSDLAISKEIVDEATLAQDGTIQYKIKISNNSGAAVDLARFDDSMGPFANYLFTDVMPPEVSYSGTTGDVSCVGPIPASVAGPTFGQHGDYNLVVCGWSGGTQLLAQGESVEFVISGTVTQPVPQTFVNYAFLGLFGPGGFNDQLNDPDTRALLGVEGLGDMDALSTQLQLVQQNNQYNNVAQARYGTEPESGGGSNNGSGNLGGGLSATGQNILILVGLGIILLAGGSMIVMKTRTKKEKHTDL